MACARASVSRLGAGQERRGAGEMLGCRGKRWKVKPSLSGRRRRRRRRCCRRRRCRLRVHLVVVVARVVPHRLPPARRRRRRCRQSSPRRRSCACSGSARSGSASRDLSSRACSTSSCGYPGGVRRRSLHADVATPRCLACRAVVRRLALLSAACRLFCAAARLRKKLVAAAVVRVTSTGRSALPRSPRAPAWSGGEA